MKKSELRSMVREMVQEELGNKAPLKEKLDGPGYAIKAWAAPEHKNSGSPTFDSVKAGIIYPDYDEVLEALKSSELSGLGAYEINWIKSGESAE
jgi:hypothetical protein